jgi:hypothetical protein
MPLGNSVPTPKESKWPRSLPSIPIFRTIPLLKGVFTMTTMIVRRERSSCRIIVSPAQATRPTAASVPRWLACKRNHPAPKNIRLRRELRSLPAFAPERLATTARFFLDVVAVPMLLRALFEVNLKKLDAEIDAHVARSVTFFLAACRHAA